MKVIIIFYTAEPKPIEQYYLSNTDDHVRFLERVVELTKSKAKFAVYKLGECIGDFS